MAKTELRLALEARAKAAGVQFHHSLGDDKLEEQVIAAETAPEAPKGETITVVGPKKGRRRLGRRFGPEPVLIPIDELAKGDLEALKGDPALVVS